MLSVRPFVSRTTAVALPFALVLGSAGTAFAAKPPRTPAPTLTQVPAKNTNLTTATFAWTPAANTAYTCSKDGAVATTCASPKTYSSLSNGTHSFVLKAKLTTPSNAKPGATTYSWKVDTVAPAAPKISPIAGPTSNTSASVSFSDADASVTGYTCAIDGLAAVACTSPKSYTSLADATHTVVVTAHDAAGNTAASQVQWVVDSSAPDIPDVVPPASPTNSTSASVSFSTDDPTATFTCSLDGADPATPCTSPWTGTVGEGSHTLVVTATDAAHNVSQNSAGWVVDLTPPAVPILVTAPAANTSLTDGEVLFSDLDLSATSFSCVLDGAPAAPCTSPFTAPAPLSAGHHTFSVTALDAAGNESAPMTVPGGWTVDTTSFPAQFVTGPDSPTNDTTPTFDFLATDTTSTGFLCSLDGGAYSACSAPVTLDVSAQGSHTLSVESLDNAVPANASVPVTWSWVLDTTGPSSSPNAGGGVPANSGTVSSTPIFTFTTSDPNAAGFACSLDGGPFVPCASGYQPVVGDGTHTLVVGTVDQAGNVSTSTLSYTWTLDTTRPVATPVPFASLTTPVKVAFSEVVQGVTSSTVGVRLYGGSAQPAKVSCLNGSGAAVLCSSASVRAALVKPVAPLVPGQKYSVTLGAVHDAVGNLGKLTPLTFRALRTIQDNNAAGMTQAWASRSAVAAYGGRYVVADVKGAKASYRFTGTSVTWYTSRGPAMGYAQVFVDGKYKATVNNYSAVNSWHVARTVTGLAKAAHTLAIVDVTKRLVVDAVKVGAAPVVTNPVLTTRFGPVLTKSASGGSYGVADLSGNVYAMTFRGTSLSWYTVTGTAMGKAKVYVDGVYKGTFDNYASATHYNVRRTWSFADKVHTIKIVVLGTHRTGAKGSRVAVDRLVVG
jgi:hypothetical protein